MPATTSRARSIWPIVVLSRPPEAKERDRSLTYLENDPQRLSRFAWLLFNLDEFIHVP